MVESALRQRPLAPARKEVAGGSDTDLFLLQFLDFEFFLDYRLTLWYSINEMASKEADDVEAWAQAEGVPSLTDPFIQKYLSGRDALVEQEKKQRSGR